MSALNNQVGGDHYKKMKLQPILLCDAISRVYRFTGGNIAKYLCRFPHKGKPAEDLQKALHYIDLHKDIFIRRKDVEEWELIAIAKCVERYIYENELPGFHADMLRMLVTALMSDDFNTLINRVKGELAMAPQFGDAEATSPDQANPNPAVDKADSYSRVDHIADKLANELIRDRDTAAERLVKNGYTDIKIQQVNYPDGCIGIKVWGTKSE